MQLNHLPVVPVSSPVLVNLENKETFLNRLRPILAPSEILKIELAYVIVKDGHRGQYRKQVDGEGKPVRYFEHPRRVALILIDELGIYDPDLIIMALGHDTLEDTHLSAELIEHCFGCRVIRNIRLLSKVPKEGYYERFMKFGTWEAMMVKMCDRLDNLRDIEGCSVEFIKKQVEDTQAHIYPLAGNLLAIVPDNQKSNAVRLANRIQKQVDKLKVQLTTIHNTSGSPVVKKEVVRPKEEVPIYDPSVMYYPNSAVAGRSMD